MSYPFILYDNVFDLTTTATDTDANGDYNAAYVSDLLPYTLWLAASTGTKYISVDATASETADTLAIVGHNLGTAGATVSLESSATGAWAGEETERVAGFVPSDDENIIKQFTSGSDRWLRLKIISAAIAPQVGVLMVGERLDFPAYPDSPFEYRTEKINTVNNISRAGHLLGVDNKYTPLTMSASFTWVSYTFMDGDYKTFWDAHGKLQKPFVWVPNITEWPTSSFFVRFPNNFKNSIKLKDTSNMEKLSLKFEGIA